MSRRRGRPRREYRIKVRTQRRSKIDYEALARAVLEHAAMNEDARKSRAHKPQDRRKEDS